MKYDVVIIGAGLGSLTAGAKLAKEGKKVLLLEQHSQPGGCATTFQRGDFTLEVGLHEMDGPAPRDMKTRIFNDLDVFSNVEFIPVPEFYRFINDRIEVTVPHDPALASERLTELFPDEVQGIKAYFEQILTRKKPAENEIRDLSVGEFLDSIIKNDDLKLILLGNLGYFHDDPYTLSLAYYSIAQGSYYSGGASFIKGGSQRLSDHLAAFIRNHNGEVLLGHTVTGISVTDGRATGVTIAGKHSHEPLKVLADEVIAGNAIPNVSDLLPAGPGNELRNEYSALRVGASLLTLYLGFGRPLSELGHRYYSVFVYGGSVRTQADIFHNNRDDFSRRSFTFVDYGQVDSGLATAGKSVGAICCIDYLADWEGLGKKEYKEKKELVARIFIGRLEKMIPGISQAIEYYEVGTPSTVNRYTLNPGGAVYGFAQTPSKKGVDTLKSVDNLHFASAWGKTGGGFSGAIYGGYLCAYNILRKKTPTKADGS
ncbi:MAG: NAD(P)/FAD-dependent oxidoreductase [Bacteroidales bacterium]|nr:NAD(P)/FAD-dependent oxidoreductase [Bacteroidales bacterium]